MMTMLRGDHHSYKSLHYRMLLMLMLNDDDDSDNRLRYQIWMTIIMITDCVLSR